MLMKKENGQLILSESILSQYGDVEYFHVVVVPGESTLRVFHALLGTVQLPAQHTQIAKCKLLHCVDIQLFRILLEPFLEFNLPSEVTLLHQLGKQFPQLFFGGKCDIGGDQIPRLHIRFMFQEFALGGVCLLFQNLLPFFPFPPAIRAGVSVWLFLGMVDTQKGFVHVILIERGTLFAQSGSESHFELLLEAIVSQTGRQFLELLMQLWIFLHDFVHCIVQPLFVHEKPIAFWVGRCRSRL